MVLNRSLVQIHETGLSHLPDSSFWQREDMFPCTAWKLYTILNINCLRHLLISNSSLCRSLWLTLLDLWSTLKVAIASSVFFLPDLVITYSASLFAKYVFPVPLGPESIILWCSINKLKYLWVIGLGISVSKTKLSKLFSSTPEGRNKGNSMLYCSTQARI